MVCPPFILGIVDLPVRDYYTPNRAAPSMVPGESIALRALGSQAPDDGPVLGLIPDGDPGPVVEDPHVERQGGGADQRGGTAAATARRRSSGPAS